MFSRKPCEDVEDSEGCCYEKALAYRALLVGYAWGRRGAFCSGASEYGRTCRRLVNSDPAKSTSEDILYVNLGYFRKSLTKAFLSYHLPTDVVVKTDVLILDSRSGCLQYEQASNK